jgi:hypothetical protein
MNRLCFYRKPPHRPPPNDTQWQLFHVRAMYRVSHIITHLVTSTTCSRILKNWKKDGINIISKFFPTGNYIFFCISSFIIKQTNIQRKKMKSWKNDIVQQRRARFERVAAWLKHQIRVWHLSLKSYLNPNSCWKTIFEFPTQKEWFFFFKSCTIFLMPRSALC